MSKRYFYEGPVMMFDTCVADHWSGETVAVSEAKARSNLIFQYKKKYNLSAGSRVSLPGKLSEV